MRSTRLETSQRLSELRSDVSHVATAVGRRIWWVLKNEGATCGHGRTPLRSPGFALFGVLCLGCLMADERKSVLVVLFRKPVSILSRIIL